MDNFNCRGDFRDRYQFAGGIIIHVDTMWCKPGWFYSLNPVMYLSWETMYQNIKKNVRPSEVYETYNYTKH